MKDNFDILRITGMCMSNEEYKYNIQGLVYMFI